MLFGYKNDVRAGELAQSIALIKLGKETSVEESKDGETVAVASKSIFILNHCDTKRFNH